MLKLWRRGCVEELLKDGFGEEPLKPALLSRRSWCMKRTVVFPWLDPREQMVKLELVYGETTEWRRNWIVVVKDRTTLIPSVTTKLRILWTKRGGEDI